MAGKSGSSLAENVYQGVRDGILSGEYPLGAPLSRRKLAAHFGVSLLPVAEALQRLEGEGLVESRPRSGTRVRVPNPEEVRGHYLVREALETQAVRLFAQTASAADRRRLARMAEDVDTLYAASPLAKMDRQQQFETHRAHFLFHMQIAESTRCKELIQAIERNQVLIFHWLYSSAVPFDRLPRRWHQDLVDAVNSGNPQKADKAMRHHVQFRRDEVAERIGACARSDELSGFRGPHGARA